MHCPKPICLTPEKRMGKIRSMAAEEIPPFQLYFGDSGRLSVNKPLDPNASFEYISDPAKPVPYTSQTEGLTFTPRKFMSDDQREASRRPDVLTFETDTLDEKI